MRHTAVHARDVGTFTLLLLYTHKYNRNTKTRERRGGRVEGCIYVHKCAWRVQLKYMNKEYTMIYQRNEIASIYDLSFPDLILCRQ